MDCNVVMSLICVVSSTGAGPDKGLQVFQGSERRQIHQLLVSGRQNLIRDIQKRVEDIK